MTPTNIPSFTYTPAASALPTHVVAAAAGLCLLATACAQTTPAPGAREASSPSLAAATEDTAIRPFQFHAPEEALVDLKKRLAATRFPEKETVADHSQGVRLETIQAVVRYWQSEYDWRKVEAKLNGVPQFVTTIDGLDIHFLHVRSKRTGALPLLISHGWPGSILHVLRVIDPLTNPTAHGGREEDAFDVVVPSMPGYGFSGIPKKTGWDPTRIARAWVTLMKRLGYTRFVAQGGDWGALVVDAMAALAPPELAGIHSNMPGTVPRDILESVRVGAPAPAGLSAEERRAYEQLATAYKHVSYAVQMASRPQTLTGLADSPAGLAAWLLDLEVRGQERTAQLFLEKRPFGDITRDDVLDNVTLYWLTNTAISAARLYWENKLGYFDAKNIAIPVAVSVFPDELYQAPRSWTERAYKNLVHFNRLEKGGHFPAWEEPALFVQEVRAGFRTLR